MILFLVVFIAVALYLGFKDVMKLKKDAFMMDMQDLPYTHPNIKKSLFDYNAIDKNPDYIKALIEQENIKDSLESLP